MTQYSKPIIVESEYIVEPAKTPNQTKAKILNQFDKFGNTFYKLSNFIINTDELGFIPNNVLNNLRRDALLKLEESALKREDRIINDSYENELDFNCFQSSQIVCKVETKEQLLAAKELGIKTIYTTENLKDKQSIQMMNRIWQNLENYPNNLLIRDFGGIQPNKEFSCDSTLNLVNSKTI